MLIYILIACDRLEEKQEKKLRQNLPELRQGKCPHSASRSADQSQQ